MDYSVRVPDLMKFVSKACSPKETVKFMDDLAREIKTSPTKFLVDLENAKYDYAMEMNNVMNLCPYCGYDDEPYINCKTGYKICPECGREY